MREAGGHVTDRVLTRSVAQDAPGREAGEAAGDRAMSKRSARAEPGVTGAFQRTDPGAIQDRRASSLTATMLRVGASLEDGHDVAVTDRRVWIRIRVGLRSGASAEDRGGLAGESDADRTSSGARGLTSGARGLTLCSCRERSPAGCSSRHVGLDRSRVGNGRQRWSPRATFSAACLLRTPSPPARQATPFLCA
jgi:hypothetical protein